MDMTESKSGFSPLSFQPISVWAKVVLPSINWVRFIIEYPTWSHIFNSFCHLGWNIYQTEFLVNCLFLEKVCKL